MLAKNVPSSQSLPPVKPFLAEYLTRAVLDEKASKTRVEYVVNRPASSLAKAMKAMLRKHYPQPHVFERWLRELGDPEAARLVSELLPTSHKVRAGEIGEILMSEFLEQALDVPVPVKKLRHKDGRNNPIRGVDALGILRRDGKLEFYKGEAKVHRYVTNDVIRKAKEALDDSRGTISRYTALYVVQHSDPTDVDLHRACESVADGRANASTTHILFLAYDKIVFDALSKFSKTVGAHQRVFAIGVKLDEYKDFISDVFTIAGQP